MAQDHSNRHSLTQRLFTAVIALVGIGILVVILCNTRFADLFPAPKPATNPPISTTQPSTTEPETTPPPTTTAPTGPFVVSTASVGVTGDILMHKPLLEGAKTADGYDFTENYRYISEYYQLFDLMIANLEITLGGSAAGDYRGYPTFNTPDQVIDALMGAGIDLLLTANNHSYDTGYNGMLRTQEVLNEKGIPYIGTRLNEDQDFFTVMDINGIQVGLACYTYETGDAGDARKSLNGIRLSTAASALVNSFNYGDLDGFYEDVERTLSAMEAQGADATMLFIHWGNEYQLSPNSTQKNIAQELCELGVDVIVGGHPHVIQPFDTLTSSTGHETYCIYSVGNAISNQRKSTLSSISNASYTEDGMIFGVTFQKWNDGTVEISEISILPTWVNKESRGGTYEFNVIPLDITAESWEGWNVSKTDNLYKSYNRTMSIVGEGLNECRQALGLETMPLSLENE